MEKDKYQKTTPRHMIFKLRKFKGKDQNLARSWCEEWEREAILTKGERMRITSDFLSETMQIRRQWNEMFTPSTPQLTHW